MSFWGRIVRISQQLKWGKAPNWSKQYPEQLSMYYAVPDVSKNK